MNPSTLASKYNKIAQWWHDRHHDSSYGVLQLEKALSFCNSHKQALDVGCGSGGRFIRLMQGKGFDITGIDVSQAMIDLARKNHPGGDFQVQDICSWESKDTYDFIVAWDSIFHLPLSMHVPVITKLCKCLSPGGVLMYSFGDTCGEHTDQWHDDTFYYSSIGISENIRLLMDNSMKIMHLELDQYPEKHAYVIASKI